jgi:hypothetical protein
MTYAWPTNFPAVCSSLAVGGLMGHPCFEAAKKQGDLKAARELAADLLDAAALRAFARRHANARLISVGGLPGDANQIPRAFAEAVAGATGLGLDFGVTKANSPKHTGSNAIRRFMSRAEFEGRAVAGATYIMLDDVMTQGGTISELRQFIQRGGSRAVGVATLAFTASRNFSDGIHLAPTPGTRREVAERFEEKGLRELLASHGIYEGNPDAMTESEARLVLRYDSLEKLAGAMGAARKEMEEERADAVDKPIAAAPVASRGAAR